MATRVVVTDRPAARADLRLLAAGGDFADAVIAFSGRRLAVAGVKFPGLLVVMDDKLPQALRSLLRQKLVDAVQRPLPQLARRDTWIPRIPGKTLAVIGMRRSGKTSLLWQQVGEHLDAGAERAWLPLVSFEDERLLAHLPAAATVAHRAAAGLPVSR